MFAFIASAWKTRAGATFAALCLALSSAAAQQDTGSHEHSQHDHPQHGSAGTIRSQGGHTGHRQQAKKKKAPSSADDGHAGHRSQRAAKRHTGHPAAHGHGGGTQTAQHSEHGSMKGFLGPHSMSREGSGTSWVPDTTPHEGIHNHLMRSASTALLALAIMGAPLGAHEHATGVVKERMDAMAKRQKAISQRLKSKRDLAKIKTDADAIAEHAAHIAHLFPDGSAQSPTRARGAIWQNLPDFENKAKVLEAASRTLAGAEAAYPKVQIAADAVTRACTACHEKYRTRK
jgi:cytochrome c556